MTSDKKARLEEQGWKFGDAAEFLGLSNEEQLLIDVRIALSQLVKASRERHKITQHELAKRIGSSQSRIAKLEASDPTVSTDLILKAAFKAGASRVEVGEAIIADRKERELAIA